jgi:uncharacterized protein (DUF433 family)
MNTITADPLIVETPRGPSIAGTRITVYSVMDYLKGDWSRHYIKQMLGISDEQLDAVTDYIAQHQEEVERDYAEILRRAEELRLRYEEQNRGRSPFTSGMSLEDQHQLLLQRYATLKNGAHNGQPHSAGQ